MTRTVVSGVAAFALLIGAALAMNETADAGHCGGGLFSRLHAKHCGGGLFSGHHGCGGKLFKKGCGGGLFARLKARHASNCCAPEPACCEPAPAPCCEPAPAPCCEPAPAPCAAPCEAAPCGGGCGSTSDCGGGCGSTSDCGGGCGSTSDCGGCGGSIVAAPCTDCAPVPADAELAAPASSSDEASVEAPPAPTPDAAPDA